MITGHGCVRSSAQGTHAAPLTMIKKGLANLVSMALAES
jgi:hypothetical protein